MNWTATKDLVQLAKQWPAPATIVVLVAVVIFCGWAFLGGFARGQDLAAAEERVSQNTEDVVELKEAVKAGRLDVLEGQLFAARVDQCGADSDELKRLYAERVSKLQSVYRDAGAKQPFPLPNCADL